VLRTMGPVHTPGLLVGVVWPVERTSSSRMVGSRPPARRLGVAQEVVLCRARASGQPAGWCRPLPCRAANSSDPGEQPAAWLRDDFGGLNVDHLAGRQAA